MVEKWGKRIQIDGERPHWLTDRYPHRAIQALDECGSWIDPRFNSLLKDWDWNRVRGIRFPENSWIYTALDKGFIPWFGGYAPADWDGGEVLWDNQSEGLKETGKKDPCQPWAHGHREWFDIIGYKSKEELKPAIIPEWAIRRARQECGNPEDVTNVAFHNFARYISEHEEEPSDPLALAMYDFSGDCDLDHEAKRLREILANHGLEIKEISQ